MPAQPNPLMEPFAGMWRRWQKLDNPSRGRIIAFTALALILIVPATIREVQRTHLKPAELYFVEPFTQYVAGQSFPVELRVRTNGTAINAIGFTLVFNPAYLEVENMTTDKSFCTLYTENSFSNDKGTVRLSCGTPRPGFQGDSLAVRLTMRARIAGSSAVLLDPSKTMILANDGKGSNIVESVPKLMLSVQQL